MAARQGKATQGKATYRKDHRERRPRNVDDPARSDGAPFGAKLKYVSLCIGGDDQEEADDQSVAHHEGSDERDGLDGSHVLPTTESSP